MHILGHMKEALPAFTYLKKYIEPGLPYLIAPRRLAPPSFAPSKCCRLGNNEFSGMSEAKT